MHPETVFRLTGATLVVALLAVALPHRLRAHRAGGTPSRRDESALFVPLRLAGAVAYGATIAWMVRPGSVAFASLPVPAWLRWTGAGLVAISAVLIAWVFRSLGLNLTDTVVVRARHTLVTWGPYARVRHPLYAALVPHVVGFTLLSANALVAVGGVVAAALIGRRTRIEEAKLIERYGDTYRAYARRVPRYLPRLAPPRMEARP